MNYRRQKPKSTGTPRAMDLSAIAPPALRHSPFDAWEDLTPAQRATIDDIAQQMDAAMGLPRGTSKWAILKIIAP